MATKITSLAAAACLFAAASAGADEGHRLKWEYPEFRKEELYAATAVSWADLMLEYVVQTHPKHQWTTVTFIDNPVRDALRASNPDTRARAGKISDFLWHTTQWTPVFLDGLFLPLVTDRFNTRVALQITAINWQAESLAFFFTRLAHRTVGRGRPLLLECQNDPNYDHGCSPDAGPQDTHVSFISGHSAMAFSGAGLICAHHTNLPMFGVQELDIAMCGVALASATTTAVMRIVADHHWTTDVLFGIGTGLATGWVMPYVLHYQSKITKQKDTTWFVTPTVMGDGFGLASLGSF